ncbi:MAG: bifunctional DNA primase/polymerase [Methanoregulaceae archaeon]|nr:bifunctional DNA primase/polymerase [Methanoregulaceae archaeon]
MLPTLQGQSAMTTLEMTSSYLDMNLPVFPCAPGLKKPATENGFYDASLDPDVVARWFGEGSTYNVGIPTGAVSGGWVLDIDPGKGGTESLAKLTEGIELPSTPIARTGRGGLHYWWAMPDRKVKSTAGLMPGIDIRGDGGYVVVPPSALPEGSYEWIVAPWDVPFAVCPGELLRRLEEAYQQGKDPDYGDGARGQGFDIEAALRGVPEGRRDATLFQLASRLRADNVGMDSAITMIELAARNCNPPFDPREARKKVEWVYRKYPAGWSAEARQRVAGPVTVSVTVCDSDLDRLSCEAAMSPFVQVPKQGPWPHTDVGNAERLASILRGKALWCHPWKSWLIWDGARWKRDETGGAPIIREATAMVRAQFRSAIDNAAQNWAKKSQDRRQLTSMIELAKAEEGISITPDALDRDEWLLNVANGTLDLRTGELRSPRREDLITRITNVPYDPEADITRWEAFLDRVTAGSRDLQVFLYRAAGYSLTGLTTEQALFFLYGSGRNGKSTFMDLLMHVMGEYAMHTPTETLMVKGNNSSVPNDLARLKGARLVAATETEAGKRLAESLVKQLTGGDPITARFLHGEFFTFTPTFKLWLSGNYKPTIRGADDGIWRRIRLIPFEVSIPESEVDPDLKDRLKEEAQGILAWCVRGCLEWQRERLFASDVVTSATDGYRREMDTIGDFLEECIRDAPGDFLTSGDLYRAYKTWCEEHGEQARSQRALSNELSRRGRDPHKNTHGDRGFYDINLRNADIPKY